MYATKPEEIDTLIKVKTKKGNLLNSFTGEGGNRAKVYSCFIEISVVDFKTSTVLAKQQNEYKEFPKGVSSISVPFDSLRKVKDTDGSEVFEYIVPDAVEQINTIKAYLAKYSDKVKPPK
jgi:hypothetical protein